MGDVVGALPLYLPEHGVEASVVLPRYKNPWLEGNDFEPVYASRFIMGDEEIGFTVLRLADEVLGFPFYALDIPGKFDRPHIYLTEEGSAYDDEIERNLSFQIAVLEWLMNDPGMFDLLHCHDHMTGLISFMMLHCPRYSMLSDMPSFFTIHNGQYRGVFGWSKSVLIPSFPEEKSGLLDWDGAINSLATAIKCSWRISTVSPSYMEELRHDFDSLTSLVRFEKYKSVGILNGIDNRVWDPRSDAMIDQNLKRSKVVFKNANKKKLAKDYSFKASSILVSFIGRFAYEKGADLIADAVQNYTEKGTDMHFFILGSGAKEVEAAIQSLALKHPENVTAVIAYDEQLAHQIYAASDFILMPSRFEPCGLNQMYAMRYGTVPVVRHTGGLIDTVPDIGDGGYGISFLRASVEDIVYSLGRAEELYRDTLEMKSLVNRIMEIDHSWSRSAERYAEEYNKTINQ